jgi:hypothetical protein
MTCRCDFLIFFKCMVYSLRNFGAGAMFLVFTSINEIKERVGNIFKKTEV